MHLDFPMSCAISVIQLSCTQKPGSQSWRQVLTMLLVAVWTSTCHFPSFLFFGYILQSPFLQNCIVCESYFLSMLNTVSHNIGCFLCKHILLLQTSKVLVKTDSWPHSSVKPKLASLWPQASVRLTHLVTCPPAFRKFPLISKVSQENLHLEEICYFLIHKRLMSVVFHSIHCLYNWDYCHIWVNTWKTIICKEDRVD